MSKTFEYNSAAAGSANWVTSLVDPECIQINGKLRGIITAHKMERITVGTTSTLDATLHYTLRVEIFSGSKTTVLDLFDGSNGSLSPKLLIAHAWQGTDPIEVDDSIYFEHQLDMSESQSIVKIVRTAFNKNSASRFGADSDFVGHSTFNYVIVHEIPPQKIRARHMLINDGDGGAKLRFNIADAVGLLNVNVYVSEEKGLETNNKELSVDITRSASGVPMTHGPFSLINPSANPQVLPMWSDFRKNDFQWDVNITNTALNLAGNLLTLCESKRYTFAFMATNQYGVSETLVVGPVSTDLSPIASSNFNIECRPIPQVLNAANDVVVSEDLELSLSYSYPDGVFIDNHCESMITFYRGYNATGYDIHGTYQLPSPKSLLDALAVAEKNLSDAEKALVDEQFVIPLASRDIANRLTGVTNARTALVTAQKNRDKFSMNGSNVTWKITSEDLLGNGLWSAKGLATSSFNKLTMLPISPDTGFYVDASGSVLARNTPDNFNEVCTALAGRDLLVAHKSINYYRTASNKESVDSNKVPFVLGAFANQLVVDVANPMEVRIGEIGNATPANNGFIYYSGAIKRSGGISKGIYDVNASLMDSNANNVSNRLTVSGSWNTMTSDSINQNAMYPTSEIVPRFPAISRTEHEVIQPGQLVWHVDFTPNLILGTYTGEYLEKTLLQNARLAYIDQHRRHMLAPVGSVIRTPVAPQFASIEAYEKLLVVKMNAISTHNLDSIEYTLVEAISPTSNVSVNYFSGAQSKYVDLLNNSDKVVSRDVNIILSTSLPSNKVFMLRAQAKPLGLNMDNSNFEYSRGFSLSSNASKQYLLPNLTLTPGANNDPKRRNLPNVTVSVPLHPGHELKKLTFRSIAEDGRILDELLTIQNGNFKFFYSPDNVANDPKPYKYTVSVPLIGTALWNIDCVLEGTYTTDGGDSNTYSMNSDVVYWSTVGTPEIENVQLLNRVTASGTTGRIKFDVIMNGARVNDFTNLSGTNKVLVSAVPGDDATSDTPLAPAEIIVFASLVATSNPDVYTVTAQFSSSIVVSSDGGVNSYLILMIANGKPVSKASGIYATN